MKDKNEIDVGKFVKIFNNMLDSKANRDFRKWDLTCSQHAIIVYLFDHQSVETTQRDLEETFSLKNPTVTGLLNLLENKGMIQRVTNPKDRRSNIIKLTEKSLSLEKQLTASRRMAEDAILKGFTQEEKQQLESFMRRLMDNIQNFFND
ncbi:MAG: MarR family transcriptional regulator [Thermoguttaceae bacterium]|nr:MarR family transcriptional regulator [Thermoguttaceae bacterium]